MDGINQIHVNPQIGLTFAAGLRHIVRQDPDVIMVGEIRDRETADIAIRAALTGHLVFSTLHTNDAPSAITRLTDMGVENYLITSSLVAVLAQRLVRVICQHCKTARGARRWRRTANMIQTFRGAGCPDCDGRGYISRMGIFEMMELNDEIRKLIMANADASVLTAGGAPQRHAQPARRRLEEDPRGRHHGRGSDARHAGILRMAANDCTMARRLVHGSILMATLSFSGRWRRTARSASGAFRATTRS